MVVARRSAVKARTQAFNQIHALLVGRQPASLLEFQFYGLADEITLQFYE
jgi:hypothetical protein